MSTTFRSVTNNAQGTLSAGITDIATSLSLSTGDGAEFPSSNFYVTIDSEIILVGSRTSDACSSLTRAQEDTVATAHASGATVSLYITAGAITAIHSAINDIENGSTTLDSVTSAGAIAGDSLEIGGGYGDTGATISAAGVGQFNGALTTDGALAVNGAAITSDDATFALLNANATTINFAGAATTLNIGAADSDTTMAAIGRLKIGLPSSGVADSTYLMHYDNAGNATSFGLRIAQTLTMLNAPTGGNVYIRVNNATGLQFDGTTLFPAAASLGLGRTANPWDSIVGYNIVGGVNSTTRGTLMLWDGGGGNTPAYVGLGSPNGTVWYLFVEDDGTLKVHNAAPAANGDGSEVGNQT